VIRFLAPSVPWMLIHELRLHFRNMAKGNKLVLIIGATFILGLMAFIGFPIAVAASRMTFTAAPFLIVTTDTGMAVLFTLMLSQTLSMATQAFYERGDLDLLLSSPIPPARVLFVRCAALAVGASLFYFFLMTPFVLPLVVVGHGPLLAAYGVLVALAFAAAAAGVSIAMALFSAIGPRRTKTVGQVLAAFIGALIFLSSQAVNLLPGRGHAILQWFSGGSRLGIFGADSLLSWPTRAVLGEPLPFVVFAGSAMLFFILVVRSLGTRFAMDASIAPGADARRFHTAGHAGGFRGGAARSLVRKELKLILRDPALLSQVLLRLLYLVPLAIVLLRNARYGTALAVAGSAGAVVFFTSQIASSLAWITISAEDTPDLIASAPVSTALARRAKLTAALFPVGAIAVVPVAILSWLHPVAGAATAIGVLGGALSSGLINLWYEKPQPRKNFRRRANASLMTSFGELLVMVGWSAATTFGAMGSMTGLAVAVAPLALLGLLAAGRNREP
jgi:ABC-2 type transport system permease protein